MPSPIELDDQLELSAAEVHDVWADGHLARELRADEPPVAKARPESALRVGLAMAEVAGVVAWGFPEGDSPHPALSPEGRGIDLKHWAPHPALSPEGRGIDLKHWAPHPALS